MLFSSLFSLMFSAAALSAGCQWHQPLVAFWPGHTFLGYGAFSCNCTANADGTSLNIVARSSEVLIEPFFYAPQKPFGGPTRVVVTTDSPSLVGKASLKLKSRERNAKPREFVAELKDGRADFTTRLEVAKEYVFVQLSLKSTNLVAGTKFKVLGLEGYYQTSEAEALQFTVKTKSPFNVLDWQSEELAIATLTNRSAAVLKLTGNLEFDNFYGRAFKLPVNATLDPAAGLELPIPRAPNGAETKGVWQARAKLNCADGSSVLRTDRFAILDEHVVTPKIPYGSFRMGIHCHSARGLDCDRELIHDAVVRMGAKIVRIDDAFSQWVTWNAAKNDYDFTNAERFLEELERRGLAVDAIIQENRFNHFNEDFCERFARKFGERFDYYEVGNEWDLVSTNWMTPKVAVEWQRLAYRALKRGNPKVRVTTNGWAVEDSNGHANVTQKGFQEYFMAEAKGAYDIHAMHLHFPFQDYVRRLDRCFALRKACGVTEPLLLNETALDIRYRGEEEVAENVWYKILYGWAQGVTDHIWYNVRASQFDPGGGYGVINREYRPRLAFAAFSALTAVLGEHDFDEKLVARQGRQVYRYHRRGGGEIVFAGWDLGAMEPAAVAVTTDARRVWACDFMNNRTELKVKDGEVTIAIGIKPQAWVFEGAKLATPSAAIMKVSKLPPRVIHVSPVRPDYGWDLQVNRYAQVHEEYPADPATAHRTWKGPEDCSGILLFRKKDGQISVLVQVYDEKDESGDRVEVWRDGKNVTDSLRLVRARHGDKRTTYDGVWPDSTTCRINLRIIDDDGFGGVDGWMDYQRFDAAAPELESWPIVRFE